MAPGIIELDQFPLDPRFVIRIDDMRQICLREEIRGETRLCKAEKWLADEKIFETLAGELFVPAAGLRDHAHQERRTFLQVTNRFDMRNPPFITDTIVEAQLNQ